MQKWLELLIIFIVFASPLPASASVLVDDTGVAVTISPVPQRIVSLSPSNTEIAFALGLGDRVVGVTEFCNYPPEAGAKPKVGGYSTVSIEKVVALRPDLVLGAFGNGEETVSRIRSLGYPVVALNPGSLAGVLHDIQLVGQAAGAEENASRLARSLGERVRAVETSASRVKDRPRVAHVIWSDPVYVSGNGTFQDELIRTAGGVNAFSRMEGWQNIGIEDFIRADPEVLVVNSGSGMGGGEDAIMRFFKEDPRFSRVSAVRDHRLYCVDTDTVDRAGPRVVDALEVFAQSIHPDPSQDVTMPSSGATQPHAAGDATSGPAAALIIATLLAMVGGAARR